MASGKYNTMEEGLAKIAQDFTSLQASPDVTPADMQWLVEMQTKCIQKMREPRDLANPNAPLPPGAGPGAPPAGDQGMPPELQQLLGGPTPIPGAGAPPMPGNGPMPAPPRPGPTDMGEIGRMLRP